MADWQQARLIPTTGIGSASEAETRATSALLAVLSVVRPFSRTLLDPLGPSRANNARVETFIEVTFDLDGRKIRPDGLIRVSHGTKDPWIALVEVKTGDARLAADQINDYWEVARQNDYDAVLTISNELASTPGVHPADGLKVRTNSKVKVHHWSWTAVLTEAVVEKVHRGVSDPEQAWLLGELIRYLKHPASGALTFTDMGQNWANVRDGARDSILNRHSAEVADVCERWDQLARFASLSLGADIGAEVQVVLSKAHRSDPSKHQADMIEQLCSNSELAMRLRIPRTAGDLEVSVDLRSQRLLAAIDVAAPSDRGAKGRVTWLIRQIASAPGSTQIDTWVKGGRAPAATSDLASAREDSNVLTDPDKREITKFRITHRSEMGRSRKATARAPGFVDTVLGIISTTYEDILQAITPFQPAAPKVKRQQSASEPRDGEPASAPEPRDDEPASAPEPRDDEPATPTAIPLPPITPSVPPERQSWPD